MYKYMESHINTMSCHSDLCKVCGGSGKYLDSSSGSGTTATQAFERICHGCGGKGWVVIHCNCCCKCYPSYPQYEPWNSYPNWQYTYTAIPTSQAMGNVGVRTTQMFI